MNHNRTMLVLILKYEQCSCNENRTQEAISNSLSFCCLSEYFFVVTLLHFLPLHSNHFFVTFWSEPPRNETHGCVPEKSHVYRAVGKRRECIGNVSRSTGSVVPQISLMLTVIERGAEKCKSTDSIWTDKSNKYFDSSFNFVYPLYL